MSGLAGHAREQVSRLHEQAGHLRGLAGRVREQVRRMRRPAPTHGASAPLPPELERGPFVPTHLDRSLSPITGLTRQDWVDAARYLLEGAFAHLDGPDAPMVFPRRESQVSYPRDDADKRAHDAERFEGLARTLLVAAPLLREDPQLELCGIPVASYYRKQVLAACMPGHPRCMGTYDQLLASRGDPHAVFQQTVEAGLLAICLWEAWDVLWEGYSEAEQATIKDFLRGFARGNTVHQNWRLFNLLCLSFLHLAGDEVDESLMADLASSVAHDHAGDGWFRDGQSFDWYSVWAYSTFSALWCVMYGRDHMPGLASFFADASNELVSTLPALFDREGRMPMWGRSSCYRMAATAAFPANLLMGGKVDPSEARRVCSGCLMQFLGHSDLLRDGIPSLGFYGQFTPAVQGYSCAASPFWMGLAFLCLLLPAEHPFWTTRETALPWGELAPLQMGTTVLDGPGICASNHAATGATILRTGRVALPKGDARKAWSYARLAFHTAYPWETPPTADAYPQGYVILGPTGGSATHTNVLRWHGMRDGVLYRRALLGHEPSVDEHWTNAIDLADVDVPLGILRADLPQLLDRPCELTLGSYGFPDSVTIVKRHERDGARAIVLSGSDSQGTPRTMAMTIWGGWNELDVVAGHATNADSLDSLVIVARARFDAAHAGRAGLLLSQVISREDGLPLTDDDLFPIAGMHRLMEGRCSPVELELRDGRIVTISHLRA